MLTTLARPRVLFIATSLFAFACGDSRDPAATSAPDSGPGVDAETHANPRVDLGTIKPELVADRQTVMVSVWSGTARGLVLPKKNNERTFSRFVLAVEPVHGAVWHAGQQLARGAVIEPSTPAGLTFIYRGERGPLVEDKVRWIAVPEDGGPSVGLPYQFVHADGPLSEIGGLIMWLDSSSGHARRADGEPAGQGDDIATWQDRSSELQHAVVASGTTSPTFDMGAVRMHGGNESLISSAHFNKSGPGMSYVAAVRPDQETTRELRAVVATAGARSGLFTGEDLVLSRSFPSWSVGRLLPNSWNVTVSTTDYRRAQGHRIYVNGDLVSADQERADVLDLSTRPALRQTRIGDSISSIDKAFDGWIGEVMLFESPLTAGDQRLVERYLTSKWASAVIHDLRDSPSTQTAHGWADETDFMLAGEAAATLFGEGGDDVLHSGGGDDALHGGAGADRFVFADAASGANVIGDYAPSQGDVIDLSGALAEASGGLEEHVRVSASPMGTLVLVDKDGGNPFVADFSLEVPIAELDPASLTTGLETSAAGLESISLSLTSTALTIRPGQVERLVLEGTYSDAPAQRRVISADVVYTASQGRAAIDSNGLLWGLKPGSTTITAQFGGLEAELLLEVLPIDSRPFEQVGDTQSFGIGRTNHQGLAFLDDGLFVTGNVPQNPEGINGYIFRMDEHLVIEQQAGLKPESFGDRSHIGALDVFGNKLWATFMDMDEESRTLGVGLARIDPITLALEEYVDLSAFSAFQDAICFAGDDVWLSPSAGSLVRAPMTDDGPDMLAAVRFSIHGGIGAVQGLTCRGETLYVVPEKHTSHPDAMGIQVIDIPSLVPEPRLPENLGARKGLRPYNVPTFRYSVAYPNEEAPYHESFAFDPVDPSLVYLPFLSSTAENLVELRLDP